MRPLIRAGSIFVLLATLGLMTAADAARIELAFDLVYASEKATHVVVVDETGTVLESWRGGLVAGDKVPFTAGKDPQAHRPWCSRRGWWRSCDDWRQPAGALFDRGPGS
ncbi:MAG: hypothetical protein L0211_04675 [Planctomycetaceae bacterium]|nr:hypothetical protein [Planctomycetaceae bacterium]